MVNYPYESSFLAPLPAYPVASFCTYLNESLLGIPLINVSVKRAKWQCSGRIGKYRFCLRQALQKALTIYSNYTGTVKCLDIDSAYDSKLDANGWDYQSCTEMVMPMCSKGSDLKNMFPPTEWDFNKVSNKCFERFKVRPNKQMASTIYGGNRLEYAHCARNRLRVIHSFI